MAAPRRIVITGAGRGLGQAMAARFVELGQVVIGCSQSPDRVRELAQRFPAPHRFDAVDVARVERVGEWAQSVLAEGPPDILINNAAVINKTAPLWEVTPDDFAWVMNVNINGVYHVLRHFLPAMVARRQGTIINFSSGWGRSTAPDVAPYCATKYAIEGLTLALAAELPEGMCAVPLNPGIIHTDMLSVAFGESAGNYPSPRQWAEKAAPYMLGLSAKDNGQSLSVPQ